MGKVTLYYAKVNRRRVAGDYGSSKGAMLQGRDIEPFHSPDGSPPGNRFGGWRHLCPSGSNRPNPSSHCFAHRCVPKPAASSSSQGGPTGSAITIIRNTISRSRSPGCTRFSSRLPTIGLTSAGQVSEPLPKGDVLGSAEGQFFVYVVPRESVPLAVDLPEHEFLSPPADLTVTASATGWVELEQCPCHHHDARFSAGDRIATRR